MSQPTHIYASAFSRRERSRRIIRRRLVALTPAALGAATGAVVLGVVEIAPQILANIL